MTIAKSLPLLSLPDHTQLPESDGAFVKIFQEHPQSLFLTSSIIPVLDRLHPDGRYAITYGATCGHVWSEDELARQESLRADGAFRQVIVLAIILLQKDALVRNIF